MASTIRMFSTNRDLAQVIITSFIIIIIIRQQTGRGRVPLALMSLSLTAHPHGWLSFPPLQRLCNSVRQNVASLPCRATERRYEEGGEAEEEGGCFPAGSEVWEWSGNVGSGSTRRHRWTEQTATSQGKRCILLAAKGDTGGARG